MRRRTVDRARSGDLDERAQRTQEPRNRDRTRLVLEIAPFGARRRQPRIDRAAPPRDLEVLLQRLEHPGARMAIRIASPGQ
jgi:hypothetical protein